MWTDEARGVVLFVQPIVSLADGSVVGAECLARRPAPDGAMVLPSADELKELDVAYVVDNACRVLAASRARGRSEFFCSVNVGLADLLRPDFLTCLTETTARHHVPFWSLVIEVSEQASLPTEPAALATLRAVAELGGRVALDDFGTGYATLASIQDLPPWMLKIDRRFVAALGGDVRGAEAVAIVRAVLDLGHQLGLMVVAEGVETVEQVNLLHTMGCTLAQGFLYSAAVPQDCLVEIESRPATIKPTRGATGADRFVSADRRVATAMVMVDSEVRPEDRTRRSVVLALAMAWGRSLRMSPSLVDETEVKSLLYLAAELPSTEVLGERTRRRATEMLSAADSDPARTPDDVALACWQAVRRVPAAIWELPASQALEQVLGRSFDIIPADVAAAATASPPPNPVSEVVQLASRWTRPGRRLEQFQSLAAMARAVGSAARVNDVALLLAQEICSVLAADTVAVETPVTS